MDRKNNNDYNDDLDVPSFMKYNRFPARIDNQTRENDQARPANVAGINNLRVNTSKFRKKKSYKLQRGVAILLGAAVLWAGGLAVKNYRDKINVEVPPIVMEVEDPIISLEEIDFSNLLVVLNESGNVRDISLVAKQLLQEAGAEVYTSTLLRDAKEIVDNSDKEEKVVIDINSTNNYTNSSIVLTQFENEDRLKSDVLSYALKSEIANFEDNKIRVGKSDSQGGRKATDLEKLFEGSDVATSTLATITDQNLSQVKANSYGLAIYNAVAKYAYSDAKEGPDLFVKSKWGDTYSELADTYKYKVTDINGQRSHLDRNMLLRTAETPKELEKNTKVESPRALTSNEQDLSPVVKQYEVQWGDTLTGIRYELGDPNIGLHLENPNNIQAGQKLSYASYDDGPLLVYEKMVVSAEKGNVR